MLPLFILSALLFQCRNSPDIKTSGFPAGSLIPFAQRDSKNETRWGYLDEDTGEIIIAAKYARAGPFVGNYAVVCKDWNTGNIIIDKNEKVIRKVKFENVKIITSESGKNSVAVLSRERKRTKIVWNPVIAFIVILMGESTIYTEEYYDEHMIDLVTGKTLIHGEDLFLSHSLQTAGDYFFVDYTIEISTDNYKSHFRLYKFLDNSGIELVVKDDIPRAGEILKNYLDSRGINAIVKTPGRENDLEINYDPYIREKFYPVPDIKIPSEIKNDPAWNMEFDKAEPFYRDHTLLLNAPLEIKEIKYLVRFKKEASPAYSLGVYNKTKGEWEVAPVLNRNAIFYPINIRQTNNPNLLHIEVSNDEIGWRYGLSAQIDSGIYNIVTKQFSQSLYLYEGYPPRSGTIFTLPSSGRRIINFPNEGVYYRDYSRVKE
jgi:hypothetical protein